MTTVSEPSSSAVIDRRRGLPIVACGVLIISFDALLIRAADTSAWNVALWRGLGIAVSLVLWQSWSRGWRGLAIAARPRTAVLAAVLLGLNTVLFVLGVMLTTVANTVVLFASAPLFAALFSRLVLGEAVALRTWGAVAAGLGGVLIVFWGALGQGTWWGDAAALAGAIVFGGFLTLLRRHPQLEPVPLVAGSGLVCALLALPLAAPLAVSVQGAAVLALAGLLQMPLALVLLAVGPRYLPAAEVALLLLLETVLGPLWVWLLLGERPPQATLYGGLLLLATLAAHSLAGLRERRPL